MIARHLKKILILLTLPALALTLPGCEKDDLDVKGQYTTVLSIYRTTNSSRKRIPGKNKTEYSTQSVYFVYHDSYILISSDDPQLSFPNIEITDIHNSQNTITINDVPLNKNTYLHLEEGQYSISAFSNTGLLYQGKISI